MKHPTGEEIYKFLGRWNDAQKARDIDAMEEMLTLPYLNYWWWALQDTCLVQSVKNEISSCIERTLIKACLIADRPERPSEWAMRMAERSFKD